jgi:N-acyl-D-aspartate/D-glutamate deacylase
VAPHPRDGRRTPSYNAAQDELTGIGQALRAAGAGHMQLVSDFSDADAEFALLREIVRSSGRPLVFSLNQVHHAPELWRHLLQLTDEANAQGLPIKAMVSGRPVGLLMGFNLSLNPFVLCPSYDELASLSPLERMAALRSPEIRRRLLTETANPRAIRHPVENACLSFDKMYPFGDPPDYAPRKDQSVAIQAERAGRTPAEYAYDMMLNEDGAGFLYMPVSNFANNTLDAPLEMMQHANTVLGLSDGGAHCGMICDASMTTHLLTYWTRDRPGEKLSLPKAIKSLTKDPATMIGLLDRGVLAVGYKADLNVIDYDRLHLQAPDICWDLPAGGRRLRQQAPGYAATVLSGIVVARDGVSTGAFPGRLIRGAQPGPQKP